MKKLILTLSLFLITTVTISAPIKFNFTFLEDGGTAKTVGYIVYEETLLSNPGNNSFGIPNAAILDLYVVVTGTSAGDGVFTLNDFNGVIFETGGLALDFSRELVGQPTDVDPWGTLGSGGAKSNSYENKTTYDTNGNGGGSGDFNLFGINQQPAKNLNTTKGGNPPPNGVAPYVLRAASGESMAIASFSAAPAAIIPTLSQHALILFAILGLIIGLHRLKANKEN